MGITNRHPSGVTGDQSGGTELVIDYAIAPAKFERANFGRLLFPLLRDNSTLGRSPLSESLAEKSFRHDNLPFFGGIAQLVERLVRNESAVNLLTLSHVLTPTQLEGKSLSSSYLTLSHEVLN